MSFFSFMIASMFTLGTLSTDPVGVSVSIVKPELGESYLMLEKLNDKEIQLTLMVKNSGTLEADPTTVHVMFPDELLYKSSNHQAGILTTDFSRFFKVLKWEIPVLQMNETQLTEIILTIPKDQVDQLSSVSVSTVFSTPNGVAFHASETLELSSQEKQSFWSKIADFFRRLLFWWHARE